GEAIIDIVVVVHDAVVVVIVDHAAIPMGIAAHAILLEFVAVVGLARVAAMTIGMAIAIAIAVAIAIAMLRECRIGRAAGEHQRGGQGKNGLVHRDVLLGGDHSDRQ